MANQTPTSKMNVDAQTTKKKVRIFVSYSSKERELRTLLTEGLQEHLSQRIGMK